MRARCMRGAAFSWTTPFALSNRKRGIISRFVSTKSPACTVLFVTHDIEEALMCADRVIVLGGSPCNVIFNTYIDIPAIERDCDCAELNALRGDIVRALTV